MVKIKTRKLPAKRTREETVLRLARRLAGKGYRFSSYLNLARAIWDESFSASLAGRTEDYVGMCPRSIRDVLLKHREEVEEIFGRRG